MSTEYRSTARVAQDHPCLAGHFPGNPIVPGVVLLDLIAVALREYQGSQVWIHKFINVKFVSLLRPGEEMEILLQGDGSPMRFRCNSGERLLSQGSFEWSANG
jgi:3-hydroxymyristoyl/3-hydroxydecanoyl-(acyl carrier protein) dehydratase